mmetsp:Transcript_27102/g.44206  ORF Transcript_27102/g.44206 Transcript_27102/m.44206 type:complete len:404 (+) Transcript_27102:75-1286(+)|eukprot:CAMPEP_0184349138 /NCGR_PEP_ID=MMETSP1089-20130417/32194_1 /TAXON_ID=38269 ORGANISM="Gloeochaete wittrockiana, Strain SAG46.84" /NCGR_SAMPLE_ID=MMETSP1089 /ASSEMBLY_ACC=CAM_ASM_000445 /LENGTH=403 /DNA_ID=CAMNT_0026681217 /DNA_START=69 /DNA_END=1280 /DNA_ORIENTATION=-
MSRTISVSRSQEMDTNPMIMMEDILEKLKIIDYEKEFCHIKNFKALSHSYFAVAQTNPNEQFFYFTSLVSWLMGKNQHFFPPPMQFDDPNSTATNILQELKKMNFTTDFSPAKLKPGFGEAVCAVLNNLLDFSLETMGFVFKKPNFPPEADEDQNIEPPTDDLPDEIADNTAVVEEEEGDDNYFDESVGTSKTEEKALDTVITAQVDPEAWRLELERVEPQLKVVLQPDHKEWRTHIEQTRVHQAEINKVLPDVKTMLERIMTDVHTALEKIQTREKYINNQLEHLIQDYRGAQDKLNEMTEKYNGSSEGVAQLTNKLASITDDLESVKNEMENRNGSMTDTAPVVKIKTALSKLKTECKAMENRIGVVEHTLLQAKMKNRVTAASVASAPTNGPLDFDADYN